MNKSHKLDSLDGLRGLAAVVVVVWHLRLAFFAPFEEHLSLDLPVLPPFLTRGLCALLEGLYNGPFAVGLFWIMSGFVLSLQFFLRVHQLPASAAHDYLEAAFLRRYPRLVIPVCASVACAYVLHSAGLMRNASLAAVLGESYSSGWLSYWYKFSPSLGGAIASALWQTFFAYDNATTYNSVLWTMGKEFYGSLFLFAFLGVLGHRRSRFILYPLMLAIIQVLRLDWLTEFVIGIAICDAFVNWKTFVLLRGLKHGRPFGIARNSRALAAVSWILLMIGIGLPNYRGMFHFFLGSAAVCLALCSVPTRRVLSSTCPLFLGRISFGLYLIHVPVICSLSCWIYLAWFSRIGHTAAAVVSCGVTLVVTIILGYLLYIVADRPGIVLSRTFALYIMTTRRAMPRLP